MAHRQLRDRYRYCIGVPHSERARSPTRQMCYFLCDILIHRADWVRAYFGGAEGAGWASAAALTCVAVSFSSWTNFGVMVFMRP